MPKIFPAKVRSIGNSFGVLIPREIIIEEGVMRGDMVHISIHSSPPKKWDGLLQELIGLHEGKPGFEREKEDRY